MPVKVTVKKYNVAHDELFLKGKNGLYCLLPFEKLDNKKKAIFKVGMTSQDVATRIETIFTFQEQFIMCHIIFFNGYFNRHNII